MQLIYAI